MIKTYLPSVSYVIPYYNERKIIKKCIDSIKNQIYPQDKIEIIIVDNNSTDNGLSIFKEDPSIKIIKELKQGRSYARNTGWKNAKSEYIAFIDSDVTLTKQWTRYLVRSLNNSSRAAVAMGPITPVSKKQSEFGLFRLNNKTIFTNWFFMEIASATQLYPIVNTASCMYEKKVLDKLDGFDVHLQRHEDTDLSFRASELGYDIVFNKHAFSYVYWTDSLINYLKRSFLNGKTYVDLINKHSAQLTFTKNLEMIGHAKNSIKKYFKHDPNFYRIIIKIFSEIFFFVGYVFFKNKKNDRKTHYACKKKNKVELANIEEKTLDIIGQTFGAQGLISKVYLDADTKLTYSQDTVFLYKKDRGNIKFLKLEQNEAKLFLDLYLEKKVLEQPSYLVASLIINLFREELVTFAIDFNHFMFDPSIRVNASVDKKSQIFKYNCSVISQYVKPHTFSIKKEQRCFELLSHILTTKNYSIDHLEEKEKIILLKNNLLSQKKSCLSLFKESFNISQKIKTFNSIVESKDYDINKIYDDMNITNFASTIKQTENIVSSSRSILYVKFFDTFFLPMYFEDDFLIKLKDRKLDEKTLAKLYSAGIGNKKNLPQFKDPESFSDFAFVASKNSIGDFLTSCFCGYIKSYFKLGYALEGDNQCPDRYSVYDDPICLHLQTQFVKIINKQLPVELKPSFNYTVQYFENAHLDPHKDRIEAPYSLSIQLGSSRENKFEDHYSLHCENEEGQKKSLSLNNGSFALFNGAELTHYRDPIPCNSDLIVLIMHFVARDFEGSIG